MKKVDTKPDELRPEYHPRTFGPMSAWQVRSEDGGHWIIALSSERTGTEPRTGALE